MFVRPLDALEPVPILTTAAYIRGMFPSPDGRWFGFIENNFTLKKIPTSRWRTVTVGDDGRTITRRGVGTGRHDRIRDRRTRHRAPARGVGGGAGDGADAPESRARWSRSRAARYGCRRSQRALHDSLRDEAGSTRRRSRFSILPREPAHRTRGRLRRALRGEWTPGVCRGRRACGRRASISSRLETQGAPVEVLRPVIIDALGASAEFDIAARWHAGLFARRDLQQYRAPVWVDRQGQRNTDTCAAGALSASPALAGRQAPRRESSGGRETSTSGSWRGPGRPQSA